MGNTHDSKVAAKERAETFNKMLDLEKKMKMQRLKDKPPPSSATPMGQNAVAPTTQQSGVKTRRATMQSIPVSSQAEQQITVTTHNDLVLPSLTISIPSKECRTATLQSGVSELEASQPDRSGRPTEEITKLLGSSEANPDRENEVSDASSLCHSPNWENVGRWKKAKSKKQADSKKSNDKEQEGEKGKRDKKVTKKLTKAAPQPVTMSDRTQSAPDVISAKSVSKGPPLVAHGANQYPPDAMARYNKKSRTNDPNQPAAKPGRMSFLTGLKNHGNISVHKIIGSRSSMDGAENSDSRTAAASTSTPTPTQRMSAEVSVEDSGRKGSHQGRTTSSMVFHHERGRSDSSADDLHQKKGRRSQSFLARIRGGNGTRPQVAKVSEQESAGVTKTGEELASKSSKMHGWATRKSAANGHATHSRTVPPSSEPNTASCLAMDFPSPAGDCVIAETTSPHPIPQPNPGITKRVILHSGSEGTRAAKKAQQAVVEVDAETKQVSASEARSPVFHRHRRPFSFETNKDLDYFTFISEPYSVPLLQEGHPGDPPSGQFVKSEQVAVDAPQTSLDVGDLDNAGLKQLDIQRPFRERIASRASQRGLETAMQNHSHSIMNKNTSSQLQNPSTIHTDPPEDEEDFYECINPSPVITAAQPMSGQPAELEAPTETATAKATLISHASPSAVAASLSSAPQENPSSRGSSENSSSSSYGDIPVSPISPFMATTPESSRPQSRKETGTEHFGPPSGMKASAGHDSSSRRSHRPPSADLHSRSATQSDMKNVDPGEGNHIPLSHKPDAMLPPLNTSSIPSTEAKQSANWQCESRALSFPTAATRTAMIYEDDSKEDVERQASNFRTPTATNISTADFLPPLKHQPLAAPKKNRPSESVAETDSEVSAQLALALKKSREGSPSGRDSNNNSNLVAAGAAYLQEARKTAPVCPSRTMRPIHSHRNNSSESNSSSFSDNNSPKKGKPIAKMLVECCSCKFFHDMPSRVYECMVKPDSVFEDKARGVSAAITTTVKCPWCGHGMTTQCCAGWAAMLCLKEKLHGK